MATHNSPIRAGAYLSYLTIGFNMLAGLIYTPWMIAQIGQSNYGLYTLASSLIAIFIVDFGLSSAVARFVAKYRAEQQLEKINNFLGLVYKLYLAIDLVILATIICVWFFLGNIYQNLTKQELELLNVLYIIVGLFATVSFPFTNLNGILSAYEKFPQIKLCDLFHKAFIVFAMVGVLFMGGKVISLVLVNAMSGILTILIKLLIIKKSLPIKVNFAYFDKKALKEIFSFSMWVTITALAQRLIFNIMPTVIAAVSYTGSVGIALFGLASVLEGYVYTFATAINGMFMPRVSRIVISEKREELLPLMVRVGRVQLYILGLIVIGFIAIGKAFIVDIWGRPDYAESYWCTVFLIIPTLFYLPMQIADTTLVVENKVEYQSRVFCIMGVTNLCLSVIMAARWGALGASVSIFLASMLRNVLMVKIYVTKLRLDMWAFFKQSYMMLLPLLVSVLCISLIVQQFCVSSSVYVDFIINFCVIVLVFSVLSYTCFMNSYEKSLVEDTIRRILGK